MKKLLLLPLFIFQLASIVRAEDQPVLASPQWVKEHLNDPSLVILQINYLRLDYEKEHIDGARLLWPNWLAAHSPEGSFNAPDLKEASAVLQKLGINKNSKVVLCHVRNEISVTARMFVTMEYLGLAGQVSYLDGGLEAWKRAGYPVSQALPTVKKGNFKASAQPVFADKEYVLQALRSPSSVVVDARVKQMYDGEPSGNPRDGHITGALNIPFPEMVDSLNVFKPVDALKTYFDPVADKSKEIVLYCFVGQTASVVYLAGRVLGYRQKLYDASLQEWSWRNELPMEKTVHK